MEIVVYQAQRSSALTSGETSECVEREAGIAGGTGVRLENPLGIIADRSVEARSLVFLRSVNSVRRAHLNCSQLARTTGKGCPGERSATPLRLRCTTTSANIRQARRDRQGDLEDFVFER